MSAQEKQFVQETEPNRALDAKPQAAARDSPTGTVMPEDFRVAFEGAADCEGKLAVLQQYFELKAISDPADLPPGALCALRRNAELYLVEIGPLKDDRRNVDLRLHFSARHAKPALLAALVELGRKGALHRLEPKGPEKAPEKPSDDPVSGPAEPPLQARPEMPAAAESESIFWGAQQIDMTSFTRLISLAQACGMVSNVDNIATVRDAEFRSGHYLTAYYNIERMCTELSSAAQRRQQQLRREETAYRSGRLRMSPKEWGQKIARETAKTQSIDRALSQFRKVMAGLRQCALAAQQSGEPP